MRIFTHRNAIAPQPDPVFVAVRVEETTCSDVCNANVSTGVARRQMAGFDPSGRKKKGRDMVRWAWVKDKNRCNESHPFIPNSSITLQSRVKNWKRGHRYTLTLRMRRSAAAQRARSHSRDIHRGNQQGEQSGVPNAREFAGGCLLRESQACFQARSEPAIDCWRGLKWSLRSAGLGATDVSKGEQNATRTKRQDRQTGL